MPERFGRAGPAVANERDRLHCFKADVRAAMSTPQGARSFCALPLDAKDDIITHIIMRDGVLSESVMKVIPQSELLLALKHMRKAVVFLREVAFSHVHTRLREAAAEEEFLFGRSALALMLHFESQLMLNTDPVHLEVMCDSDMVLPRFPTFITHLVLLGGGPCEVSYATKEELCGEGCRLQELTVSPRDYCVLNGDQIRDKTTIRVDTVQQQTCLLGGPCRTGVQLSDGDSDSE